MYWNDINYINGFLGCVFVIYFCYWKKYICVIVSVLKSATGLLVEDTTAFELIILKELGKFVL